MCLIRCPMCGDPMTLVEYPSNSDILGDLYWECGFCDEIIPDDEVTKQHDT